jgi:hypothetical protein
MRHDREKLVDAGPGDGPARLAFCQLVQAIGRGEVPLGVFAVRIDEQVGVDRPLARILLQVV